MINLVVGLLGNRVWYMLNRHTAIILLRVLYDCNMDWLICSTSIWHMYDKNKTVTLCVFVSVFYIKINPYI